VELIVS